MKMLATGTANFADFTLALNLYEGVVDTNVDCNGMTAEPNAGRYGAMILAPDQSCFRERLVVWIRGLLNSDMTFDVKCLLPAVGGRL